VPAPRVKNKNKKFDFVKFGYSVDFNLEKTHVCVSGRLTVILYGASRSVNCLVVWN
jgi:hypothetical protein